MTITTRSPAASGCLFVLAAPSGGGKTSLVNALLEREPGIRLSVSYTTRPPRPGEQDGVDYHFVDEPRSWRCKASAASSWSTRDVHGNWYGDLGDLAQPAGRSAGHDVLLEIDWQGAQQVRRLIPEAVLIFILPPSLGLAARSA